MITVKEWALADAQRMQKPADRANMPAFANYMKQLKHVADHGGAPPEAPETVAEARVPEFHYSGERIFEVSHSGASRAEVTEAIQNYVAVHRKAPKPTMADTGASDW